MPLNQREEKYALANAEVRALTELIQISKTDVCRFDNIISPKKTRVQSESGPRGASNRES